MKTPGKNSHQCIIRLSRTLSLIFFVWMFVIACNLKGSDQIAVVWKDSIPEAVSIPLTLLNNSRERPSPEVIQVRLQGNTTAILGGLESVAGEFIFRPILPFTPGMKYEVVMREQVIGHFTIPEKARLTSPALTVIYPSGDTLPANLLKFYLQFSTAMREGEALQHIHLLDDHADTIPDVFLQLQPELWNAERTELTVWIDPGRIKRELIPNKEMGNPLVPGRRYTLSISPAWKNIHGTPLQQSVRKPFVVDERDSLPPDPLKWSILTPKAGKTGAVRIEFYESLDYFLIKEAITFLDENGNPIAGKLRVAEDQKGIDFMPTLPWQPGTCRVRVDARLEDLAGNNLNRPFDRDISIQGSTKEKAYFERIFMIAP